MGKIIAVFLILLGIGGGVFAGLTLRPVPEAEAEPELASAPVTNLPSGTLDVFELPGQFMVPVIADSGVHSIMVLSLALEIDAAEHDHIRGNLPRLRDALLQVMFDHANTGGFDGMFTAQTSLGQLRRSLLEAGQQALGRDSLHRVLITEILRSGG